MRATQHEESLCVYCETGEDLTREHVPPRCLFGPPRPPNLITVPCCRKCNNGAAQDDEYFRLVMCVRHETRGHADARAGFGAILRSFTGSKQRGFRKAFFKKTTPVELWTSAGLYLGETGKLSVDNARIHNTVGRVARGIYWHATRAVLPAARELVVREANELTSMDGVTLKRLRREVIGPLLAQPEVRVGEGTFRCWFLTQEGKGGMAAAWLMRFYDSIDFLVLSTAEPAVPEGDHVPGPGKRHST